MDECTGTFVTFWTGDIRYSPLRGLGLCFSGSWSLLPNTEVVVEAVGMWESRRDFQRVWEGWEAAFWLSMLSTLCHFRGLRLLANHRRRSPNSFSVQFAQET